MMRRQWQWVKLLVWFLAGLLAIHFISFSSKGLISSVFAQSTSPQPSPTIPQPQTSPSNSSPSPASPIKPTSSSRVEDIAAIVYQKLPFLPLENQYRRQDTGQVDLEHTLVSRFIRYHQDIKKRATRYRLDWKLTLADYLGENEIIVTERYPGSLTLQTNPIDSDVKAIRALNRLQRLELVNLFAQIYKPQVEKTTTEQKPQKPTQPAVVDPSKPGLSQPGDSQLLKF